MAVYNPLSQENIYDIAAKLYGDTALGISDILGQNPTLNIDDVDLFGTPITYTIGLKREKPVFPVIEVFRPGEPYTTRLLQSAYDLAIQLYGDISKIGNILNYFPNLDTNIPVGSSLTIEEQTDPIAVFFKDKGIIVSTDFIHSQDVDNIIQEDDSNILQETGDLILIE